MLRGWARSRPDQERTRLRARRLPRAGGAARANCQDGTADQHEEDDNYEPQSRRDTDRVPNRERSAFLTDASRDRATGEESSNGDPGENASSGNTPHVGPKGSVEVDTLRWKLKKAKTSKTIGDQEYGLGAKANGIYVIANLSVKNNKNESVTLTSETVSLVSGEKVFKPDTKAEVALIGEGGNTFLAEDVGPSVTAHGEVAFDVPPSILKKHPELRFNELGLGETHGYIALPTLKG